MTVAEWLDGSFESQSRLEKPNSGSIPESPKICLTCFKQKVKVHVFSTSASITGLYVISEAAFTIGCGGYYCTISFIIRKYIRLLYKRYIYRLTYYWNLLSKISKWHVEVQTVLSVVCYYNSNMLETRGRRGRDRMVVGYTTTYAISSYHH